MSKKTYVPQLARMALKLNAYILKHNAALSAAVASNPSAVSALQNCPACLASLAALAKIEQP